MKRIEVTIIIGGLYMHQDIIEINNEVFLVWNPVRGDFSEIPQAEQREIIQKAVDGWVLDQLDYEWEVVE